ncbi:phorbol-12-myristate-13-acetate-induced protein 1 isoform X2 [Manis pentadactyla]|uniref:phorbol-12-myristate-13-acetate-induced protein 1 isoform X2 n=1 Tax=Manis pentadactyla TaxID=143292 RepID=UPI00255CF39D|nr:phorbol-12-myristate-13-acetate-induced protein 1 isoform X2 [Manis pentadactyla]
MPGKKARKNAQPSPSRAPAGREPLGPAEILAGAGAGVEVSVRAGSASLRRAARSGQVCALSLQLSVPFSSEGLETN